MLAFQNLCLFGPVDMCIDLGGHDRTMAQQGLDIFDINVFLKKEGSKGMPEHMRCYMFFDTRMDCQFLYDGTN